MPYGNSEQERTGTKAMKKRGTPPDKIERFEPKQRKGLLVIVTGNGKGKTTSAVGMAVRALGHGMKVCIVRFMKGDLYAGEWDGIARLGGDIELHATGKGFCGLRANPYPWSEHRVNAQDAVDLVREKMASGLFDLMILDEINNAVSLELVDLEQLLEIIGQRPPMMHLILTGRDAHPRVIDLADTVSEIREIKHAYRKGVEPQPGVDY